MTARADFMAVNRCSLLDIVLGDTIEILSEISLLTRNQFRKCRVMVRRIRFLPFVIYFAAALWFGGTNFSETALVSQTAPKTGATLQINGATVSVPDDSIETRKFAEFLIPADETRNRGWQTSDHSSAEIKALTEAIQINPKSTPTHCDQRGLCRGKEAFDAAVKGSRFDFGQFTNARHLDF